MKHRKGILIILVCLLCLVPVSAEESADDIVAMMGWWEEYGRYWAELGAEEITNDDEMAFSWLDTELWALPAGSAE